MKIEEKINRVLGEGLGRAGAEGLIGGAAMMVGSMAVAKMAQKLEARKDKKSQIEALEKQKEQLRDQMKDKDEAGKESIRKKIANIDLKIEQIKRRD